MQSNATAQAVAAARHISSLVPVHPGGVRPEPIFGSEIAPDAAAFFAYQAAELGAWRVAAHCALTDAENTAFQSGCILPLHLRTDVSRCKDVGQMQTWCAPKNTFGIECTA